MDNNSVVESYFLGGIITLVVLGFVFALAFMFRDNNIVNGDVFKYRNEYYRCEKVNLGKFGRLILR